MRTKSPNSWSKLGNGAHLLENSYRIPVLGFPVIMAVSPGRISGCLAKKNINVFQTTLLHTQTVIQVITFLTSKSWETRIAAGQAVEAIVKNVKPWRPVFTGNAGGNSRESTPASEDSTLSADLLSFNNFDINQVCN